MTMMKRIIGSLLMALCAFAAGGVELNGQREFIRLNWKNSMARPAFSISFKVRMNKEDMVIPAHVKNRGRVLFEMNASPKVKSGLQSIKIFFQMSHFPTGGYAGFQAVGIDPRGGKRVTSRYNAFWRAANSQVPTDEFVTVTIVYCDDSFDVYLNRNNIALLHKRVLLPMDFAAPEYVMSFGGMFKRHSVKCAIEDIMIFDRALDADDVSALIAGSAPAQIVGLKAHYPMKNNGKAAVGSGEISVKLFKRKK